jgi:hypothetical protein
MAEKTLDQFPQEFFDAWDLAQAGTLWLEFPEKKQATNFRHRLYSFRTKLRKQAYPMPCPYDGIELMISQSPDGFVLAPGQSSWREQIAKLKAENATNSQE